MTLAPTHARPSLPINPNPKPAELNILAMALHYSAALYKAALFLWTYEFWAITLISHVTSNKNVLQFIIAFRSIMWKVAKYFPTFYKIGWKFTL